MVKGNKSKEVLSGKLGGEEIKLKNRSRVECMVQELRG